MELSALSALGVLDPDEAATFEAHLAEGCPTCEAEVRAFRAVAGYLGYAVPPERPRPEVRDRLLAYVSAGNAVTVIGASEGEWGRGEIEGVMVKILFRDPATRRITALGRIEPGVRYPSHRHADTEELYMLEGDLTVEGQVLRGGDYCAAPAGTVHGVSVTRDGCTYLVFASEQDQIITEPATGAQKTGFRFVYASEGAWQPGSVPGVSHRPIFSDPARGTSTHVVRVEAGARLPRQRYVTAGQLYMLRGDCHLMGHVLQAGDYLHAPVGTAHDLMSTEGGCEFLLISSRAEALD